MQQHLETPAATRLRHAALAPLGEEGRAELVASRLIQTITTGAFAQGERLPAEQELAELLGVAIITVRGALSHLRQRGYIETKRGRVGGSFVKPSYQRILELNAAALKDTPRIALSDLGIHYDVITTACGVYACRRATTTEIDTVLQVLESINSSDPQVWRRQITDVQLEIAALSQSVRLTNEHINVHTECLPFFSLQDSDADRREQTRTNLVKKLEAIRGGDESAVADVVHTDSKQTMRWLLEQQSLLKNGG